MYKINIKNKADYYAIINYLFEICDKFKIVSLHSGIKNIERLRFIDKLNGYCIEEKLVRKWPGMVKGPKSNMKIYPFNKETLKLLEEYKNFFEYKVEDNIGYYGSFDSNEQIDISFYNGEVCILYTICHEGLCISEDKGLKEILYKKNIEIEEWI